MAIYEKILANNPRLYTVDNEADEILTSIPKGKRSSFVSEAVKLKAKVEKSKARAAEITV